MNLQPDRPLSRRDREANARATVRFPRGLVLPDAKTTAALERLSIAAQLRLLRRKTL